jgi:uncharacterized protein YfaS (alpha-2-macroglobulin family)
MIFPSKEITLLMRRISLIILAVLCSASGVIAQSEHGTIRGSVRDKTGSFAPGSEVTLINLNTKEMLATRTDDSGEFRFEVPSGSYSLAVQGSSKTSVFGLNEKQTVQKNFTLGSSGERNPPQSKPRWIPLEH